MFTINVVNNILLLPHIWERIQQNSDSACGRSEETVVIGDSPLSHPGRTIAAPLSDPGRTIDAPLSPVSRTPGAHLGQCCGHNSPSPATADLLSL